MSTRLLTMLLGACLWACTKTHQTTERARQALLIHTPYSNNLNAYKDFDAPKAINRLAEIENTHFAAYSSGSSPYYGTQWRIAMMGGGDTIPFFRSYIASLPQKPDSMHCTIYAVEGLKAGLGQHFEALDSMHKRIWKQREFAGWSVGYLLVTRLGWRAYLIIDPDSPEYAHCSRAYRRNKSYPVWRQPDIPLEEFWEIGRDDSLISRKLGEHEFGWGFSYQGYHTWITRFDFLKECNWYGAPGSRWEFSPGNQSLFLRTPFSQYQDYLSHVIIFPPPDC